MLRDVTTRDHQWVGTDIATVTEWPPLLLWARVSFNLRAEIRKHKCATAETGTNPQGVIKPRNGWEESQNR